MVTGKVLLLSNGSILHQTFTLELDPGVYVRGDIRVKEDGGRKPVLLFVHGFKGFKDWAFFPYAAEQFAGQDFAVITFNFSFNGVNEHDFDELDKFGMNTYTQEQKDLSAVLAALLEGKLPLDEQMDKQQIFIVGHSRGGGNSVIFAAEHPEIRGVVTWNGIAKANLFGEDFREQVLRDGVGYVTNARTKQEMPINAAFLRIWIGIECASLSQLKRRHFERLCYSFKERGCWAIAYRILSAPSCCSAASFFTAGRSEPYFWSGASFCRDDG